MCLSCGCGDPEATHGDDRSITIEDIEAAAEAHGMSSMQVYENILHGMDYVYTRLIQDEMDDEKEKVDKVYQVLLDQMKKHPVGCICKQCKKKRHPE